MMKIDILTLFPEMFSPLEHSIVGKAREKGLLDIHYHNFREYAEKARHVDDEPYGGGQGMLLRAQPIFIEQVLINNLKIKIPNGFEYPADVRSETDRKSVV